MNLHVIAVGRARRDPCAALYADYAARLAWPIHLKEVEDRRGGSGDERRRREGDLLLAAVPDGAIAVALDAGGQPLDSEALAARIGRWQDSGTRDLAFVIGGANGLAPAVLQRADFTLSLGALTWPHMLVRAMLCEQVYRAGSILSGHPYHRGH